MSRAQETLVSFVGAVDGGRCPVQARVSEGEGGGAASRRAAHREKARAGGPRLSSSGERCGLGKSSERFDKIG